MLADTNVAALAVKALRAAGHDVIYVGERLEDPGDAEILAESLHSQRILTTKDHDIGALVFRDSAGHAGVVLIDDLGSPDAETKLLINTLATWEPTLIKGGFVRAGHWGSKRT